MRRSDGVVLVISQTFVPDPAAVGQCVSDAAFELARRGHRVRVGASGRGYENPAVKYPRREMLRGVDVRRFPLGSLGKKSMLLRVLGTAGFMVQAFFAALFTPNLKGIFFSTSPPLIGVPMCIAAALRRVPTAYWAMDLNPDQLIALGKLKSGDLAARVLEWGHRFILWRTTLVIALDRFMAERLEKRGVSREKMMVMPPWPHEEHIRGGNSVNPFREKHGLAGKFVVMYSGNHSPSNPLTTLLEAAVRMKGDDGVMFLFVGGGSSKRDVEKYMSEHGLSNARSLPYQPLADLKYSLTAADVHVVSLGEHMVGIVHPCKVYGAMSAEKPVLFLGPEPSHISDLLKASGFGLRVAHGDVEGMVAAIGRYREMGEEKRREMGLTGAKVLEGRLSQAVLCGAFCDRVERVFFAERPRVASDAAE